VILRPVPGLLFSAIILPDMPKWTYFTQTLHALDINQKLDEYSERGWELVSLAHYPTAEGGTYFFTVFRKPDIPLDSEG
jgi:hypothetical protein